MEGGDGWGWGMGGSGWGMGGSGRTHSWCDPIARSLISAHLHPHPHPHPQQWCRLPVWISQSQLQGKGVMHHVRRAAVVPDVAQQSCEPSNRRTVEPSMRMGTTRGIRASGHGGGLQRRNPSTSSFVSRIGDANGERTWCIGASRRRGTRCGGGGGGLQEGNPSQLNLLGKPAMQMKLPRFIVYCVLWGCCGGAVGVLNAARVLQILK